MDQTVTKILSVVAIETLEKMAFIFGSYIEDNDPPCLQGPVETVAVRFSGVFSGTLTLRISNAVLPELAANMLGIDESGPVGIDHQQDALREVANVICGRLLPLIGGKEAEFSIEQPAILGSKAAAKAHGSDDPIARVSLNLEEGGCDLVLALDGELPTALPPEALEITKQDMDWTTL